MKRKRKNLIKNILTYILVFSIPLGTYWYTLSPTLSLYSDSGEFPTVAAIGSFGHPPGFPLFILILKLFILLPFKSVAYKCNLASAFIGSITVIIFYILIKTITKDKLIAFIAIIILTFSKIFWRNAITSEVFTLTALLTTLIFLFFQIWINTQNKKFFYWFLIAAGFGLGHHQGLIVIVLLPILIFFLWNRMWRQLTLKDYFLAVFFLTIGFLPYIYIFIVAHKFPFMNWENPQNLKGLFRLITRASFGTFQLMPNPGKINFYYQIKGVFQLFWSNFYLSLLLILPGLYLMFKKNLFLFFNCLFLIISIGFIFSLTSGMPLTDSYLVQYLERFQLNTSLFLIITMSFGLLWFKRIIETKKIRWSLVGTLTLLVIFFMLLLFNLPKVNQRNNYFSEKMAEDILSDIPQNSILLFGNDHITDMLQYSHYILGKRPDIEIISLTFLINSPGWWLEEIKIRHPMIFIPEYQPEKSPSQFFYEFLNSNSQKRTILLLSPEMLSLQNISTYKKQFPFIGLVQTYIPPWQKITSPEEQEKQITEAFKKYQVLKNKKNYPIEWSELALMEDYTKPWSYLAKINPVKAEEYYQKAVEIAPYWAYGWYALGEIYEKKGEREKAIKYWLKSLETNRAGEILKEMIDKKIFWLRI
jgi:tetratricopeptide (TPR) repeat protein